MLDLLHKIGVGDNVSFYNNNHGKSDLILNMLWQRDFDETFIMSLSSMTIAPKLATAPADSLMEKEITLQDYFRAISRPKMLHDNYNKWYCNKCAVCANEKMEPY